MYPRVSNGALLIVLVCGLTLTVTGQLVEDDWIDPYDMLKYDPSTKTMRKATEPESYPNVPTKRREHTREACQADQTLCDGQTLDLRKQIEDLKKKVKLLSQQPMCAPVFKRFLSRLLKEIQRVGLPSDSTDVLYDASVKLSKQSITEIQKLLDGEESWRTGALDNAISQILVDFKPHNYEAWKWHFEDTFGVELDTVLKLGLGVLLIVAIICTELWSKVSWFVQFRRLFALCFFISIIWNWIYMYKTAFADHQKNMAKLDGISEKCTGVKKFEWSDSLKEWFRSTWTLQDDPCKKYYEVLLVNPLLLVPPSKAISVTIVTLITEPLKHIGEGISDFIRALLKDLPVTMQIPVIITIVLIIMVSTYVSVQASFQYGLMAPFRRRRRDPPPPRLRQAQNPYQELEYIDQLPAQRPLAGGGRTHRNHVNQRGPNRQKAEEAAKVVLESLHAAERPFSEDETDARLSDAEQNLSDPEIQPEETQEELRGASGGEETAERTKESLKPTASHSCQSKTKPRQANKTFKDKLSRGSAASQSPAEQRRLQTDEQEPKAEAEDGTSSRSSMDVGIVNFPVQESSPVLD